MTHPFKNTYIKTAHLSGEELYKLAEKYSKATGYPFESYLNTYNHDPGEFDYIASVIGYFHPHLPGDCISVGQNCSRSHNHKNLTEITEQDLDEFLTGESS